MKHLFSFPLMFALLAAVCSGQEYRGTVQGLVVDSSEAIVVGAKVTLLNVNTGIAVAKETNANGQYRFDLVDPGAYTLSAEMAGFNKAVQEGVRVQTRGDVTANFTLKPGGTTETVTVTASPVALQFNTSSKELTIDRKQVMDIPIEARNPFTLALLDPAVQNIYPVDRNPFYMWAASQINVGGRTSRENDLLIDGAPVQIGPKGSYTPTMDAVQEVTIQQNSVDAEFGHSAGGILSLAMREGTNEIHGSVYYFGRNPQFNAATNSITHQKSKVRNHQWGGTVGGPIRKNKLFTFFAYEGWKTKDPMTTYLTLPTSLERAGDFSKSLNSQGNLRVIYDPYTTKFDPVNNIVTRQPFADNVIPKQMLDPAALKMMSFIWDPNNAGDDVTGRNNFKKSYSGLVDYWNFSNRTDWNVSEKLRIFGRYSRFHTITGQEDYTPNHSIAMTNGRGGIMASRNITGDAVYTATPSLLFDFRFSYAGFDDSYNSTDQQIGLKGLDQFWPGNPWYQLYTDQLPQVYFPALDVGGNGFGIGWFWIQQPHNYNWMAKVSKSAGRHTLKAGFENRRQHMFGIFPNLMNFSFSPGMTANTFQNPDTKLSGDPWATFLLGAIDNNSNANYISAQNLYVKYYSAFVQDDIKLSRRITLNLGMRYEYESAPVDERNRYSRYIDLTNPIPEMQANPPAIPSWINDLRGKPAVFNGAWIFTDDQHRTPYNAQKFNLGPRVGAAIRITDKTAVQVGWARFIVPGSVVQDGIIGGANFPGFSVSTNALPAIAGVPAAKLSNPFPANSNPLLPVVGKTLGRYTNLGNGAAWRQQDYDNGVNDRLNFTLQRELPGRFKLDATFFMHFARHWDYTTVWDWRPINMTDPNLVYTLKSRVDEEVANPFYMYLTPDKFPGQLRNRETVSVGELLRQYPQYGDLYLQHPTGGEQRYKALQLRVQRAYANGVSLLWGYNYNRERLTYFLNDLDWYAYKSRWRMGENPRHRMNFAGTFDLPFGKGRPFMSNVHPILNGILGGWSSSSLLTIASGSHLLFWGGIDQVGEPAISNPTPQRMFNTGAWQPQQPYTPRTAPIVYDGVLGPKTWNLDTTLVKSFPIKERFSLEFRAEAYNLTNSFVWANPDTWFFNSTFGRCTGQANRGRELQYTLRLTF